VPGDLTVGYVGLGKAGGIMAGNLRAAGHPMVVSDVDAERERAWAAEHDATVAEGPQDFAGVDVLMTMLPNGHVVRGVLLGDGKGNGTGSGGIAAHLRPGTVVVDTSSADPLDTRALGAELARRDVVLLDAPVTRPIHDWVNTRNITIMVAGDDEAAVDRVLPLLEAMAERVFRVGRLGNGHAMKTLNNYVAASGLVAALDAMAVALRFGLDVETMLNVFNVGTARNFSTASVLLDESMSRRYGTGFQLALLVKDMGIAERLTKEVGFEPNLLADVQDAMRRAMEIVDDPQADHSAAVEAWEQWAGRSLPPLRAPV